MTEPLLKALDKKQLKILRYSTDVEAFIKEVLGLEVKWFHREWIDLFQNERFIILLAPRGSGKSFLVAAYAVWQIVNNPDIRILIVTVNQTKANELMSLISAWLQDSRVTNIYGMQRGNGEWSRNQIRVRQQGVKGIKYREPTVTVVGQDTRIVGGHYDCCIEGTKVWTSKGLKNIEELTEADRVYCHDGTTQKIYNIQHRKVEEDTVYGVRIGGSPEMEYFTSKHGLLKLKEGEWGHYPDFEYAANIKKGDWLLFPKFDGEQQVRNITRKADIMKDVDALLTNTDFFRFLGYYLAEGCISKPHRNRIRLSFGKDDKELVDDCVDIIERLRGITPTVNQTKTSTLLVDFSDPVIWNILYKFRRGALNKYIPTWVLRATKIKLYNLLRGYLNGDGCAVNESNNYSISSASLSLLVGFKMILAKLGIYSNILQCREEQDNVDVVGNNYTVHDGWNLNINANQLNYILDVDNFKYTDTRTHLNKTYNRYWWKDVGDYFAVKVNEVEKKTYAGNIWTFEVENTHTYLTFNGISHNCIILDDIVDKENSRTQYRRDDLREWFNTILMPMLEPDATLLAIGTRYHADDLYHNLIESSRFKHREYRAIIHEPSDEEKAAGKYPMVLWPERYPYEELVKIREQIGSVAFSSQYQNRIIATEDAIIKPDWITEYKSRPSQLDYYFGVDLSAAQKGEKGDYFVICVIGIDNHNNVYVVDMLRTKCSTFQKMEYLEQYNEKWRPIRIGIEANAMQKEVVDMMKKATASVLPIKEIKSSTTSSKEARVERLSVLFETGRIFLNRDMREYGQLVDELLTFPKGQTDDCVDSLCFAVDMTQKAKPINWKDVNIVTKKINIVV